MRHLLAGLLGILPGIRVARRSAQRLEHPHLLPALNEMRALFEECFSISLFVV